MKKTTFVMAGIVCSVIISMAFTKSDPPRFKNLQVLPKDISERALDSIMHFYTRSLNVRCGFCHVGNQETHQWDMASDLKTDKQVARQMMLMTDSINKKYFPEELVGNTRQNIPTITCYTCHRGNELPVGVPATIINNRPPGDSTRKQ